MHCPVLKTSFASSAPSLHKPSLHHRVRGGTDSVAWSQRSEQQRERERERERATQNKGGGGWGRQSQVWCREIQKDGAREHEDTHATPEKLSFPLVILHHPACVFSTPATLFMALWLRNPRVGCHFSARPCHSPPRPTRSAHRRVGCRQRSLNLTPAL